MPIFISVDPERDTVEQVSDYVQGTVVDLLSFPVQMSFLWEERKLMLNMYESSYISANFFIIRCPRFY